MTTETEDPQFESLLEFLKQNRGLDFTSYKRPSLTRRVRKRMEEIGVESYGEYLDHLEVHPDEFAMLFDTVLINVTSFFRNPAAWAYVQAHVLPTLAKEKGSNPIRVWVAGCAGGQESYTAAMVLAEALGEDRFREKVKIYATDVDEDALSQARQSLYSPRDVNSVPEGMVERYFEQSNGNFVFRKDLRRNVIFGRNDLVRDAPISRIDLLVCRNVLMYFNAETQSRILNHFRFSLTSDGILMLGKGEMLLTRSNIFTPLDLKHRVFTKVDRQNGSGGRVLLGPGAPGGPRGGERTDRMQLRENAYNAVPTAQIVVSAEGRLVMGNDAARALFLLAPHDFGRPIQDLEISYRPLELRSLIEQSYSELRPVNVLQVEWSGRGAANSAVRRGRRANSRRQRQAAGRDGQLHGCDPVQPPEGGSGVVAPTTSDSVRGAAIDHRGVGDDQRGAPVDE